MTTTSSRQELRASARRNAKLARHEQYLFERTERRRLRGGPEAKGKMIRDFVIANQYPEAKRTEHHTLSHTVYRKVTDWTGKLLGHEVDHVNTPKTYSPNGKREVARRLRQMIALHDKRLSEFKALGVTFTEAAIMRHRSSMLTALIKPPYTIELGRSDTFPIKGRRGSRAEDVMLSLDCSGPDADRSVTIQLKGRKPRKTPTSTPSTD